MLIPSDIAKGLVALRGDAPALSPRVPNQRTADQSTDQGGGQRAKVNTEAAAFQGSGSDPGLTAALGRLKFNVGRRSEA